MSSKTPSNIQERLAYSICESLVKHKGGDIFVTLSRCNAIMSSLAWVYDYQIKVGKYLCLEMLSEKDKKEMWALAVELLSEKEKRIKFCKSILALDYYVKLFNED